MTPAKLAELDRAGLSARESDTPGLHVIRCKACGWTAEVVVARYEPPKRGSACVPCSVREWFGGQSV